MPNRSRYGQSQSYKRRSQVYKRLRTRKIASGHYLVEHEPSKMEFYIFKRPEHEDWAVAGRDRQLLRGGFRKKDDVMEVLAEKGPKAIRIA